VRLIENWSPGKRGEVRRKFASFDRTAKGGIGIGTLFHIAKEHGWKPPQQVQRYTPKKGTNARAFDLRGAL
jgi:Ca2+-binding EF-hand superfamily protein